MMEMEELEWAEEMKGSMAGRQSSEDENLLDDEEEVEELGGDREKQVSNLTHDMKSQLGLECKQLPLD